MDTGGDDPSQCHRVGESPQNDAANCGVYYDAEWDVPFDCAVADPEDRPEDYFEARSIEVNFDNTPEFTICYLFASADCEGDWDITGPWNETMSKVWYSPQLVPSDNACEPEFPPLYSGASSTKPDYFMSFKCRPLIEAPSH